MTAVREEPPSAELFRSELNRWVMLAGALVSMLGGALFTFAAANHHTWAQLVFFGAFVPMMLWAALACASVFRYPRRYSIEISPVSIRQPFAPGCPTLLWSEVTRLTGTVWGGFWLSDASGARRVRVWDEVPRFMELLDVVLERGSVPLPTPSLVLTRSRWQAGAWVAGLIFFVGLLAWLFSRQGPNKIFWFALLVIGWAGYTDLRRMGRNPHRVEVDAHTVTLTNRSGNSTIPLNSIVDVRFVPSRQGLTTVLVGKIGDTTVVPAFRQRDVYRLYHALRRGCPPDPTAPREARATEFADARRRLLIGVLVGGAIAGLSTAVARGCGRTRRK